MLSWFRQLDELLRGKRTAPHLLAGGRVDIALRVFTPLSIVLGGLYGFFMGWYAFTVRSPREAYLQLLASAVKLPALFLLTLVVTFPSLYVFNALIGCRLTFGATLRLLIGAVVMNLAVAASLGPILGFFTVSTTSYTFIVLLNVILLAIGGIVGLAFLLQTLRRMTLQDEAAWTRPAAAPPPTTPAESSALAPPREPGPLEPPSAGWPGHVIGSSQSIFRVWVIIYALVGAQMGWLLRPFIGNPNMPFTWFRPRSGNFFQAIADHLSTLFNLSRHAGYP